MRMKSGLVRVLLSGLALLVVSAGLAPAADKSMMHCFTFTPIKTASQAEWDAFYKATEAMPSKMPGIVTKTWAGKLMSPQSIYNVDADNRKKFSAGTDTADIKAQRVVREYGACMEFTSADALKKYEAHPYHADWMKAYEKVRVAGTTTFNFVAQ